MYTVPYTVPYKNTVPYAVLYTVPYKFHILTVDDLPNTNTRYEI